MDDKFNNESIKTHNELRYLHRSPYLVASKRLAEESQEWANLMAEKSELKHSNTNGNYGENIAISSLKESGEDITLKWYKEIFFYKFGQERQEVAKVGHFTQVIWNESIQAGFGRALSIDGNWYIVGRYIRAGNIIGKFIQNINHYTSGWNNHPLIKKIKKPNIPKHFNKFSYNDSTFLLNQKESNQSDATDPIYFQSNRNQEKINESFLFQSEIKQNEQPKYCEEVIIGKKIEKIKNNSKVLELEKNSDELKMLLLQKHNYVRKLHRVENLILNDKLCQMAQNWAEKLRDTHQLNYSNETYLGSEVGENIAISTDGSIHSCTTLVDKWYKEESFFEYGCEPENINEIGHFSQIVWNSSRDLGVGISKSTSNNIFVVCFYFPPGNIKNEFAKNINPILEL